MPTFREILESACCLWPLIGFLGLPVIVAASRGVRSAARLAWSRRLLAVLAGILVGVLTMLVLSFVSMVLGKLGVSVLMIGLCGSAAGACVAAYTTGRFVALRLNWYVCPRCLAYFQSAGISEYCAECYAKLDHAAVAGALADFDDRYRAFQATVASSSDEKPTTSKEPAESPIADDQSPGGTPETGIKS